MNVICATTVTTYKYNSSTSGETTLRIDKSKLIEKFDFSTCRLPAIIKKLTIQTDNWLQLH